MAPEEICRRLGETKVREIFLSLPAEAMKKILQESDLSTKRGAREISTAQRNASYADRFWRHLAAGKGDSRACATMLYEFLVRHRRSLLAAFLDSIGVKHDQGLTDADFLKDTPRDGLREAARKLLGTHDRTEVAAYLLFLDATAEKPSFEDMGLEDMLGAGSTSAGPQREARP